MQKLFTVFSALLFCGSLLAQVSMNTTLLDTWTDPTITNSGLRYNDCWGYTAPDGREYAIIGSRSKIHFIDITDPTDVVEVASFTNLNADGSLSSTLWRDFKTYDHYAYAVADQSGTTEGLIVFDLSDLPNSVSKVYQTTADFTRAHNVFIDVPKAKMYIPGAQQQYNGMIVYSLANPAQPSLLASVSLTGNGGGGYSHDVYVRNDTAYCFQGTTRGLRVYDFSTPTTPQFLGSLTGYSNSGYNHSGWLTEDSQYLIFCDETAGREVMVADVRDLTDITAPSSGYFHANLDNDPMLNNIAHNVFVKGDYAYVAYYNEGIQVFDVSDPMNAVLEGYYDTWPSSSAGNFDGVWGVYPFFDSGTVIGSDTQTGLYVIRVNSILPVELTYFTAEKTGKVAKLTWETAFERNNDVFEIQRSTDGEDFTTIMTEKGSGTTNDAVTYSITDENPVAGSNYYRLKQIDFDGIYSYSDVERVEFAPQTEISILPTLLKAGESVQVRIAGLAAQDFSYRVTDVTGRLVNAGTVSRFAEQTEIPAVSEVPGIYFIEVGNDAQSHTEKVVVE